MSTVVTPDDVATYLDIDPDSLNTDRAQMLIDDAIGQALTVATVGTVPDDGATEANLPPNAASVIRPAVARIYLNPAGVTGETAVGFAYTRTPGTGSMYSKSERATLRRLAGQAAGAFTIDPTPEHALDCYRDPLWQPTDQEALASAEETGLAQ